MSEAGIQNKVEGTLIRVFKRPLYKGLFKFFGGVNEYQGIRTRMRCAYSRNMKRITIFCKIYERVGARLAE